jgi:hypothetical protein
VRGVTPAPGRVGQPAGAKRRPPRGRPTGGRGGAGKTEGTADARARASGEREERLTGGAGRKENTRKWKAQLQKSKTGTSRAPKFTKFLLKQDHTTKNIMQKQTLKKALNIARNNSSKTAVFKLSKNFMARKRHLKIEEKYLQITI